MSRVACVAALVLLLAGCMAKAPPAVPVAAVEDDDGMVVTATRVEPLVHVIDTAGRIRAGVCTDPDGQCASSLGTAAGHGLGLDWESPTRDFADPAALFWRVSLRADWQSESLVDALRMTVYVTEPCGIACVDERQVAQVETRDSPTIEALDLFLQPGETGVRVRLEPVGMMETAWGEAAVDYHLYGGVAGYRPVADPVVVA